MGQEVEDVVVGWKGNSGLLFEAANPLGDDLEGCLSGKGSLGGYEVGFCADAYLLEFETKEHGGLLSPWRHYFMVCGVADAPRIECI